MRKVPYRWHDWTVLLLGTWLLLSPFFLPAPSIATANAKLVGLAFVLFAALAIFEPRMWEEWLNLVCAAWLIVSPFVLGFTDYAPAAWNAILTGLLIGAIVLGVITGNGARAERAH
jgi:hypothetical protein